MILPVGATAPDFELPSLGQDPDTQSLCRLAELLEVGPVFLCFVKENCPTCRYALTLINRIYLNYSNSKVSLRVIVQEAEPESRKLAEELGLRIPILLDGYPYAVSREYGLTFVPTCYFVNSEGSIQHVMESFQREELSIMNGRIADTEGVDTMPFFTAIEGVPDFKPG